MVQAVMKSVPVNVIFDIESNGKDAYKEDGEDMRHGVSYQGLKNTVALAKSDPSAVQAKFFTHTEWNGGAQCVTTCEKFELGGVEHKREDPITLVADEPLLSGDAGPSPNEAALHGIGNCISVIQSYYAGLAGIPVESFKIDWDNELDMRGFMDLDDSVSPCFKQIDAKISVTAGGKSQEELLGFYKDLPGLSPICDSMRFPVDVTFGLTFNGESISSPPLPAAETLEQ